MIETICEGLRMRFEAYKTASIELENALRIADRMRAEGLNLGSLKPREVDVVNSRDLSARYEDLIVGAADIERMMSDKIAELEEEQKQLKELIKLAPIDLGLVLTYYYINCNTNVDVCNILMISDQSSVNKMKKKAFQKIAERLYEKEDNKDIGKDRLVKTCI